MTHGAILRQLTPFLVKARLPPHRHAATRIADQRFSWFCIFSRDQADELSVIGGGHHPREMFR